VAFDSGVLVGSVTDVGMRRTTNQDSYSLIVADTPDLWRHRGHFLMVADGMGAHAAGELASKLAAEGVPHLYHKLRELSPPEALQRAIVETNAEVHRRGMANPDFHNMGTTASALVLLPQGAIAAHIGDSRIYRLRGGVVQQLTFDHSLQWELRAAGQIVDGTDAAAAVPKNVITRSLGPNATVQVDLEGPHPVELHDVFLLCSDGLTGRVEDDELGIIMGCLPPQEAAQLLVDLANLRGGPDNITVLVARVIKGEATTVGANAPPLALGSKRELRPVHPALWITAGVCALAGGVMALMGHLVPGGIALLGAAIAGFVGVLQRFSGFVRGTPLGVDGRMLGKGPYTQTSAMPNPAMVAKLISVLEELRVAARDNGWELNWSRVDDLARQAAASNRAGRYGDAIASYGRAVMVVMQDLRAQNIRKGSDSAIQY
jgi:serine/threonine protein phosphatase PrpC